MKKIYLLVALMGAGMLFAQEKGVNYALASNGSSAVASSGDAAMAIDNNNGTRWESDANDNEWWTLDMGQLRTFNTIRINWEGAYAKEFNLLYSTDSLTWNTFYAETDLASAGWQTIYKETAVSARYVHYQGIKRATGWGQSFWEFQVLNADAPRDNIAKGKTIVASSAGADDVNNVVDGNFGTLWQGSATDGTTDDEEARTYDAWFVVDLGDLYDIDQVNVAFEGACAQDYHIDFSENNTAWNTGYNYVGVAGINGRTDEITELTNNIKVRYVRFWSTKAATQWGVKVYEIEVFGEKNIASGIETPSFHEAAKASKIMENGVLYIERDGSRYDVTGALIR